MKFNFSFIQRLAYALSRHIVSIILVVFGLWALWMIGNQLWVEDSANLALSGFVRVGLGISAILLVTKFAYPKLNVQETVKNDSLATAILVAGLAIAVALLF